MIVPAPTEHGAQVKHTASPEMLAHGALQMMPKARPVILATAPNAFGLLLALRRRWMVALTLGLLAGALAAAGMWYAKKTTYTVRTLLSVPSQAPVVLGGVDNRNDFANYQRNQVAYVRSRFVLSAALRNPKAAVLSIIQEKPDPIAWLEKEIQVDFGIAPEILRIAITGDEPGQLTVLMDAVREAYLAHVVNKEKNQRSQHYEQLRKLQTQIEAKVQERKVRHDNLRIALGTGDAKSLNLFREYKLKEHQVYETHLLSIEAELLKENIVLAVSQLKAGLLPGIPLQAWGAVALMGAPFGQGPLVAAAELLRRQNPASAVPEGLLLAQLKKEPQVAALITRVADFEEDLQRYYTPDQFAHEEYKKKHKLWEAAKTELAVAMEKLRPQAAAKVLEQANAATRMQAEDRRQKAEYLHNIKKAMEAELTARRNAMDNLKKEGVKLEELLEEKGDDDILSKKISAHVNSLEIELGAPDRVTTMEDATAIIDTDARIKNSAMGGAGAFAFILLGVAFLEFRQRRVNNVEDITRGLSLKLMGTLPAIPQSARRLGASQKPRDVHWQNLLTESVDAARTMLLHMVREQSHQVVMVTSAVGGEGKTLLSCHLAVSLAKAGFRTLLVDCDMRRPAVHKLFNLPVKPGWSELLAGQTDIGSAIQTGPLDHLSIIPAGFCDAAALQALARHQSKELFQRLKGQFDFILVDSAPLLPVADSLLIAQSVDGVMLSILRDVSRLPAVYAAYERLASLGVNILGAVVNGTAGDYYHARYDYQRTEPDSPVAEPEPV